MQTPLEKKAIENRQNTLVKNDYNKEDEYSSLHKDALSDGDPQGKGSGNGGHTHYTPNSSRPSTLFNYSNIDTRSENIGGQYDIEGRNGFGGRTFLKNINLYSEENQYGPSLIDTESNVQDGQIIIK